MKKFTVIGLAFFSIAAQADIGSAPNPANLESSTATQSSFKKNITLSYWGNFAGPSVGYLGGDNTPAFLPGANGSPINQNPTWAHAITFGYKLDDKDMVGVVGNFSNTFFAVPAQQSGLPAPKPYPTVLPNGPTAQFTDPALKIGRKKMIDSNGVTLSGAGYFYIPIGTNGHPANNYEHMRTLEVLDWEIPKSRWTLGLLAYQDFFLAGQQPTENASQGGAPFQDLAMYWGPNVGYKLSERVGLTLYYEMSPAHQRGGGLTFVNGDPDIEAGVSIDITPKWNFNPYLQFYPWGTINFDTLTFGWYLVGTVF